MYSSKGSVAQISVHCVLICLCNILHLYLFCNTVCTFYIGAKLKVPSNPNHLSDDPVRVSWAEPGFSSHNHTFEGTI